MKSSCPEWKRERIPNPSGEIPLQVRLLSATPFRMGHSLTDRISDSESEDTGPIPLAPTI